MPFGMGVRARPSGARPWPNAIRPYDLLIAIRPSTAFRIAKTFLFLSARLRHNALDGIPHPDTELHES